MSDSLVPATPEQSERNAAAQEGQSEDRFRAEPNDLEIDVPKTLGNDDYEMDTSSNSQKSEVKSKKKRKREVEHVPQYLRDQWEKPFQIGWGREIVYRATTQDGKRAGDVYYFSPEGRKLRSKVEVEKHLSDTSSDLPTECFTFRKEPVYKEPFEIIRNANASVGKKKSSLATSSPNTPVSSQTPSSSPKKKKKKNIAKKLIKQLAAGTAGKGLQSPILLTPDSSPALAGVPGAKPFKTSLTGSSPSTFPSYSAKNGVNSTLVVQPKKVAVAKKHTGKRNPTISRGNGAEKRIKLTNGNAQQKLCDYSCGTSPPTVSCEVCLCLFHPHCVGHFVITEKFVCKACRTGDDNIVKSLGHITVLPRTSPAVTNVVSTTPGMRIITPQSLVKVVTTSPKVIQPHIITPSTSFLVPTAGSALQVTNNSTTKAVTSTSSPIRLNIPLDSVSPNQVSGQLITLPPHVTTKLNLQKPLNLKLNGQTYYIPSSCFIATAEGVKVLLPPGSLPDIVAKGGQSKPLAIATSKVGGSQQLDVKAMENGNSSEKEKVVDLTEESRSGPKAVLDENKNKNDSATEKSSKKSQRFKSNDKTFCHFKKLHAGFDCMLHIFGYLPIQDLLRVKRVCRTWQGVAMQNCLWKSVRLRNLQINDWERAARSIKLHQVQYLDLRGLAHPNNDPNRTWHQFHSVLCNLTSLKQIEFSGCPSSVLHAVTEHLLSLRFCTAEAIVESTQDNVPINAKLDLGKFSQLKELESLTLRGSQGLVLPAFAFSGGLVELGNLKALKVLALTTLRDISAPEFQFLGALVNLEVLEVGDCFLWEDKTYNQIENLLKLTSLRLEGGGSLQNESLGKSLQCLERLKSLELINFVISEHLGKSLTKLKSLEKLSVWPNTDSEAAKLNSNLLDASKEMSGLKVLEWGVMNEGGESGDGISLLPTQRASGDDDEAADLVPQHLTINELIQRLSTHLPDTKIRVFKVPSAVIKKVCPQKRVESMEIEADQ